MYLMYVDESGDPGLAGSPKNYFALSAIVIHEHSWKDFLVRLNDFRKKLKETTTLKIREEIRCSDMISKPGPLNRIPRHIRLDIIKKCIDWLNSQPDANVFSVVVNKNNSKTNDVFEKSWSTLITRFENTIRSGNFNGPRVAHNKGIVITDNTDGKKLTAIIRKMRHYNAISNNISMFGSGYRNMPLQYVIEDPVYRDSKHSLIHQMCDVLAYCARAQYEPNAYMKKKEGYNFYKRLTNVSVKHVSHRNEWGIVEL